MKFEGEYPVALAPPYVAPECTRCTVESVDASTGHFQKASLYLTLGLNTDETKQILTILTYPDKERRAVILKDVWSNTDIRKGMQLLMFNSVR